MQTTTVDFSDALRGLHEGKAMTRKSWVSCTVFMNGDGYYMTVFGRMVPWCPTWDDLSGKDWHEFAGDRH